MAHSIGMLIFDDVEELDFLGPWEVFGFLCKHFDQESRVWTVSERGGVVTCAKGLRVLADYSFADAPRADILLVPGGWGTRKEVDNPVLIDWLRQRGAEAAWRTSVCTGAFLLERAGLLGGRRGTTHWGSLDRLRDLGTVDVVEERFVVDGPVVSAAGVSAGLDMALWLVGQVWGEQMARAVQKGIEYYPDPPFGNDRAAAMAATEAR